MATRAGQISGTPSPSKRALGPGPKRATGLINPAGIVGLQPAKGSLPKPSQGELTDIEFKVYAGERLSAEDGLALYACEDLLWLGQLARYVQRKKSGNNVYFNINRHINLTNLCKAHCHFCSFRRGLGEEGGYTMSHDEIVDTAVSAVPKGITELHIVNGLHPELDFDYYLEALRRLKAALPDVHLKAFTAVEIWWFARITGLSYEEVLKQCIQAGLGSLPGGGAEIFAPRVRRRICGYKSTAEDWLAIHRSAHILGLRTNATMLYGHIETPEERIDHVLRLRDLQDETGGFQVFIPLRFHNEHNLLSHLPMATPHESLKVFTVSRLLLDNFEHMKAYWIMLGLPLAQMSLRFGVDDLDGTVVEERIYHMAGAETPHEISQNDLLERIREAGRVPVQRDTVYKVIRTYDN